MAHWTPGDWLVLHFPPLAAWFSGNERSSQPKTTAIVARIGRNEVPLSANSPPTGATSALDEGSTRAFFPLDQSLFGRLMSQVTLSIRRRCCGARTTERKKSDAPVFAARYRCFRNVSSEGKENHRLPSSVVFSFVKNFKFFPLNIFGFKVENLFIFSFIGPENFFLFL